MRVLIFYVFGTLMFAALYAAWRRAFLRTYSRAWARRAVRGVVHALPLVWGAGMLVGGIARRAELFRVAHVGFSVAGATLVLLLCTLPPLIVSALVRRYLGGPQGAVAAQSASSAPTPPRIASERPTGSTGSTRRELLVRSSAALPVGGLGVAAVGGVQGWSAAQLVELEMRFPDLPADLDGLRLLHYTDMHLGTYVDLLEVARLVELGRRADADLVLLTGDMSDDLSRLLPALRMFEGLAPKYGLFASIGNHEYFRGLRGNLIAYAKTDIEMLIEQGVTIEVGASKLYIGGADDPRVLRGDKMAFMNRTVRNALDRAPSEAFRLLLSHRPEGFVPAAQEGFHLTLSGHTHGAQLGFDGRSLLEDFMPERFLWGAYRSGDSRLYTSSGAGHWFPFRVGCPREVPVIVLRRGAATDDVEKRRLA